MTRQLRLEFPGAIYHVTSRGNAQSPIFLNDENREVFLNCLGEVVARFGWFCHAYCLMENYGYSMATIARQVGLHYSTVSKIIKGVRLKVSCQDLTPVFVTECLLGKSAGSLLLNQLLPLL